MNVVYKKASKLTGTKDISMITLLGCVIGISAHIIVYF